MIAVMFAYWSHIYRGHGFHDIQVLSRKFDAGIKISSNNAGCIIILTSFHLRDSNEQNQIRDFHFSCV